MNRLEMFKSLFAFKKVADEDRGKITTPKSEPPKAESVSDGIKNARLYYSDFMNKKSAAEAMLAKYGKLFTAPLVEKNDNNIRVTDRKYEIIFSLDGAPLCARILDGEEGK